MVAVLGTRTGVAASVNFGVLNPAGTSHYVQAGGCPAVYLMPRMWKGVARGVRHGAPAAGASGAGCRKPRTGLLLPVSMAQVWAIEIVAGGKLSRFEREAAGNWFKHTGQHAHTAGNSAHVADPAQARIIDAALPCTRYRCGRNACRACRCGRGCAKYGLALPTLIVLFYARDSSTAFGAA